MPIGRTIKAGAKPLLWSFWNHNNFLASFFLRILSQPFCPEKSRRKRVPWSLNRFFPSFGMCHCKRAALAFRRKNKNFRTSYLSCQMYRKTGLWTLVYITIPRNPHRSEPFRGVYRLRQPPKFPVHCAKSVYGSKHRAGCFLPPRCRDCTVAFKNCQSFLPVPVWKYTRTNPCKGEFRWRSMWNTNCPKIHDVLCIHKTAPPHRMCFRCGGLVY